MCIFIIEGKEGEKRKGRRERGRKKEWEGRMSKS
jgi:hypothetical protein